MFVVAQCNEADDGQGCGDDDHLDACSDHDGTADHCAAHHDDDAAAPDNASTPEYHSVSRGRCLFADDVFGQLLQAR